MRLTFTFIIFCSLFSFQSKGQTYGNEWIDYTKTYYKFPVREARFYRITQATLNNFGIGSTPAEHFQLWRNGKEVPIFTSVSTGNLPANGFIEFAGIPNDASDESELFANPANQFLKERSFFGDTAWYFLTINPVGSNMRFEQVANLATSTKIVPDSFYWHTVNPMTTINRLSAGFARVVGGDYLRSSVWDQGEGLSTPGFNAVSTSEYNLINLKAFTRTPHFSIKFATTGVTLQNRTVTFRINNQVFDTYSMPFLETRQRQYNNASVLDFMAADAINFKFNSNFTSNDASHVNEFYLTYPRQFFHNNHGGLRISLEAKTDSHHLRIGGLPNGNTPPVIYDLTNLKRYTGIISPDTSAFLLEPSATDREIVIGTQVANQIRNITSFKTIQFKNYALAQHQAEYMIISHFMLMMGAENQVENYANYRRSFQGGGYTTQIYNIDDLAEQFGYGVRKTPLAIRRFILFAIDHFQQKPKMVFLIGKGTNYFNYLITGGSNKEILNAVPTFGMPASDNLLATRNNLIPVPEIPIGRLSAVNSNEVKIYLDKVKEYEALQQKQPFLPSDNDWRKRVIHLIGGDDEYLADSILARFMKSYTDTIKLPKVGAEVRQYKRPGNLNVALDMLDIENRINTGTSLITYFGHSSTSSIDFNLGSPRQFSNTDGKYPLFITNGCRAGNIFDLVNARLTATELSLSESFVFAPKNGAIGFISNSDLGAINYQNLFTSEWYNAISKDNFNQTIGQIQKAALQKAFDRTGISDFLNRCNIEQSILHGDPALQLFTSPLPDFAVEADYITSTPNAVFTENDSVDLKIKYSNIGKSIIDSVNITVQREVPGGGMQLLYSSRILAPIHADSFYVKFGVRGLFEEGQNHIIVKIDALNQFAERDEDNNTAALPFTIERKYIQPAFPYNYSIVNNNNVLLNAVTTDPLEASLMYRFEMDTTAQFNSPLHMVHDTICNGGVVGWLPNAALLAGKTYYWRTYKSGPEVPGYAEVFSFTYLPGTKTGFNQSHFYQYNKNEGSLKIAHDRKFVFGLKKNNLYVSHGIFSSSGTEDGHFSITHNGEMKIRSACVGRSIIFNLFDEVTFEPLLNVPGGLYGSASYCGAGKEYNFEFRYAGTENRKLIMDFIDQIPAGTFVASRLVVDPPFDSLQSRFWQNDTLVFGSGNSLYHSLKKHGFYEIDSLNKTRTFFFIFKKDDSLSFKPYYQFSNGTIDRLHISVFPESPDTTGTLISPWMGPAKSWDEAHWQLTKMTDDLRDPLATIKLWGKTPQGSKVLLGTYQSMDEVVDISSHSALQYPFMQFELTTSNDFNNNPAQLKYWRLYYEPVADGALSGNAHFVTNINTLKPEPDTLKLEMAFKNISNGVLAATTANVYLVNEAGENTLLITTPLKLLNPSDSAILKINQAVSLQPGAYELRIIANELFDPQEVNYFNNLALLRFVVSGSPLPLQLLSFDAAKQNDAVSLVWNVSDDREISSYTIEHSSIGGEFKGIGEVSAKMQQGNVRYEFLHTQPAKGLNQYRLKLNNKDGSFTYSYIKSVQFNALGKIMAVPNPFNHYFTLQPSAPSESWIVRVIDMHGKTVLTTKGVGSQRVDMSGFAKGIYLVEYTMDNEKQIIKMIKH